MDIQAFREKLSEHANHVKKVYSLCKTEEASKTALILPMFQRVLEYNVADPSVFIPEYVADIGAKQGEKVDYAIMKNGSPEILIEAKWSGYSLDGASSQIDFVSQLYRYFNLTSAKIGILTNGVEYRFYGDLDSNHQMDKDHFYKIDIRDLKEEDFSYLLQFHSDNFNAKRILDDAADKKLFTDVNQLIEKLLSDPDHDFTGYIMKRLGTARRSKGLVQNFQPIIKQSIANFVSKQETVIPTQQDETTQEEIAAYYIIKTLLHKTVETSRIQYKDCKNYFAIMLDGISTHWICRLYPAKDAQWQIHLPAENPKLPIKKTLNSNTDLLRLQNDLIAAVQKYL